MIGFTMRNLRVYFKDRSAVFFSMLAVFIIIGLYVLFLGDVWTSGMEDLEGVRFLMDSWIMAGLLAVTSVTTSMGAFGTLVDDRVRGKTKDFTASPIRSGSLVGGYVLSAFVIGVIMCLVTLVLAEVYILAYGGALLSVTALLKTLGVLLLTSLSNTALVMLLVSFFRSANAFATASTIIGTLIGFLTGIYLPIGALPNAVQWVVKLFPVSHAAALLRQIMMEAPMSVTFAGAPAQAVSEFSETMGVTYRYGETTATPLLSILVLLATALIFFALAVWNMSRKKK